MRVLAAVPVEARAAADERAGGWLGAGLVVLLGLAARAGEVFFFGDRPGALERVRAVRAPRAGAWVERGVRRAMSLTSIAAIDRIAATVLFLSAYRIER
jgi:hypothetical protein